VQVDDVRVDDVLDVGVLVLPDPRDLQRLLHEVVARLVERVALPGRHRLEHDVGLSARGSRETQREDGQRALHDVRDTRRNSIKLLAV